MALSERPTAQPLPSTHRCAVLCRLKAHIRAQLADPELSLHYWDWTTDPRSVTDSDGRPLIGTNGTPGLMGDDGSSGIWTALSEGAATNPDWGGEVGLLLMTFKPS